MYSETTYSWVPIIRPELINVTGLVFENSKYNRKSSAEIKIKVRYTFFKTVCMYDKKDNAVMKMNSTIHQKLEQYLFIDKRHGSQMLKQTIWL